jgi:hypothetical protein
VLYLFTHGVVFAKGSSTTVFPWRDTEIRRSVVLEKNAMKPDYRYWLQRPGSPSVELSPTLELDEFGPEMERRLTAARAPADLDAVAAGQRIQYGPYGVDLTGLTTSKGTIPWPQIRAVEVKDGQVQVWGQTPAALRASTWRRYPTSSCSSHSWRRCARRFGEPDFARNLRRRRHRRGVRIPLNRYITKTLGDMPAYEEDVTDAKGNMRRHVYGSR